MLRCTLRRYTQLRFTLEATLLQKSQQFQTLDIAHLPKLGEAHCRGAQLRDDTRYQWISQFYVHIHSFIHERNEPYLPLPFQPKPLRIYRLLRDLNLGCLV